MQYSQKKFLAALILGRGVRYGIGAYLGFVYGRHILRFFNQYYKPAMAILIGLAVIGSVLSLIQYLRYKKTAAAHAT
jgi:membrane protein DedA with SNARE-associated domain